MENGIRIDRDFKPHQDFKTLYYIYMLIGSLILYLLWAVPLSFFVFLNYPLAIAVTAFVLFNLPFIIIIASTAFWIPRFYSSILYLLTESDIVIGKGVWWKHKSIVPYNRVTNIEVVQGPLSRRFGLGKVSVQTAGFSAGGSSGSGKIAEAVILGTKNFEEVKNVIMKKVKRLKPTAVEAETELSREENIQLKILEELKRIRKSFATTKR